ncbi:MAG: hypothetical protein ACKPKO_36995, partial [Candidatus Fonsibacter sp.]
MSLILTNPHFGLEYLVGVGIYDDALIGLVSNTSIANLSSDFNDQLDYKAFPSPSTSAKVSSLV